MNDTNDKRSQTTEPTTAPTAPNEINDGDIVQLKTGGPEMTVRTVQDRIVLCDHWSKEHNKFHTERFGTQQLLKIVAPPPEPEIFLKATYCPFDEQLTLGSGKKKGKLRFLAQQTFLLDELVLSSDLGETSQTVVTSIRCGAEQWPLSNGPAPIQGFRSRKLLSDIVDSNRAAEISKIYVGMMVTVELENLGANVDTITGMAWGRQADRY